MNLNVLSPDERDAYRVVTVELAAAGLQVARSNIFLLTAALAEYRGIASKNRTGAESLFRRLSASLGLSEAAIESLLNRHLN